MRFLGVQLFLAPVIANGRNDPPPSSDRPWAPPELSKYEGELAGRSRTETEGNSKISINPRNVYGLVALSVAELARPTPLPIKRPLR